MIAWTFLDAGARRVFRDVVGQDSGTWARARGWALWKALLGLTGDDVTPGRRAREVAVVDAVVAETVR